MERAASRGWEGKGLGSAKLKALSDSGEQEDAMNEYLEASKQQPAKPTLTAENSNICTAAREAPEIPLAHSLKPAMTPLCILSGAFTQFLPEM